MKRLVLTLVAFVAAVLVALPALAADFVWTTEEVEASRFEEADSASVGTIEAGQRVEVLFAGADRVRVKLPATSKFGWIEAAKTTDVDPVAAPEEPEAAPEPEPEPEAD